MDLDKIKVAPPCIDPLLCRGGGRSSKLQGGRDRRPRSGRVTHKGGCAEMLENSDYRSEWDSMQAEQGEW